MQGHLNTIITKDMISYSIQLNLDFMLYTYINRHAERCWYVSGPLLANQGRSCRYLYALNTHLMRFYSYGKKAPIIMVVGPKIGSVDGICPPTDSMNIYILSP